MIFIFDCINEDKTNIDNLKNEINAIIGNVDTVINAISVNIKNTMHDGSNDV